MKIRLAQTAVWAVACSCLTLGLISCDVLNPALVGQLGGDAGNTGPTPTGSIIVVFNNQTPQRLTLNLRH